MFTVKNKKKNLILTDCKKQKKLRIIYIKAANNKEVYTG